MLLAKVQPAQPQPASMRPQRRAAAESRAPAAANRGRNSGFNEAAAACRCGMGRGIRLGAAAESASMRPQRRAAAESEQVGHRARRADAASMRPQRRAAAESFPDDRLHAGRGRFNEAAAACRCGMRSPKSSDYRPRRFNEAAAACRCGMGPAWAASWAGSARFNEAAAACRCGMLDEASILKSFAGLQ